MDTIFWPILRMVFGESMYFSDLFSDVHMYKKQALFGLKLAHCLIEFSAAVNI